MKGIALLRATLLTLSTVLGGSGIFLRYYGFMSLRSPITHWFFSARHQPSHGLLMGRRRAAKPNIVGEGETCY
jgi:hypothetical protein